MFDFIKRLFAKKEQHSYSDDVLFAAMDIKFVDQTVGFGGKPYYDIVPYSSSQRETRDFMRVFSRNGMDLQLRYSNTYDMDVYRVYYSANKQFLKDVLDVRCGVKSISDIEARLRQEQQQYAQQASVKTK